MGQQHQVLHIAVSTNFGTECGVPPEFHARDFKIWSYPEWDPSPIIEVSLDFNLYFELIEKFISTCVHQSHCEQPHVTSLKTFLRLKEMLHTRH